MNETMICAVGNVATRPVYSESASGPSVRFRLAATPRYWDREKNTWVDGHTSFFTVWGNRQLAVNVAASVSVGEPVIVQGRLKVRSEVREGQTWTSADIDAVAIGHDLARGTDMFRRAGAAAPEPNWETAAASSEGTEQQQERAPERRPEPAAAVT
ncbi:single-stranded DNA-binding protein [Streptomyces sp. NPDC018693]|uniref:single-stranded DNA-binding protein n=1 Tax=unclassified Streptomyces TaxID=2593676 RepID=UPI00378C3206